MKICGNAMVEPSKFRSTGSGLATRSWGIQIKVSLRLGSPGQLNGRLKLTWPTLINMADLNKHGRFSQTWAALINMVDLNKNITDLNKHGRLNRTWATWTNMADLNKNGGAVSNLRQSKSEKLEWQETLPGRLDFFPESLLLQLGF